MSVDVRQGDCRDLLHTMPSDSVDCVVTSPPYFGLRDYGCDGQIGLEETPSDFVAALVDVFREVRRVLKPSGTCWLNLGDSYAGSWGAQGKRIVPGEISRNSVTNHPKRARQIGTIREAGLKPKDLIGIPWRAAFALQDDGWWLRSDIIWAKPNPMPESVRDRPTKAHEYLFLLTKSDRYFFDAEAAREARVSNEDGRTYRGGCYVGGNIDNDAVGKRREVGNRIVDPLGGRNMRSVWNIATQPFGEAHFATFPPELAERCIKAGCPVDGLVLDPFSGAGTTAMVADRLGRSAIGIELNPDYVAMAERRIAKDRLERRAGTMVDVAAGLKPTPIEAFIETAA